MLKDTELHSGVLYIGRNAGKSILRDIENAQQSIRIITPYISSDYVELLRSKVNYGVDVSLILSSDIGGRHEYYKVLRKLIVQRKQVDHRLQSKRRKSLHFLNFAFVAAMIAVGILFFHYGIQQSLFGLIALPVLFLIRKQVSQLRTCSYFYRSDIKLSIPLSPYTKNGLNKQNYLTHAKVYIIDDRFAYVGSVNFTKASFWMNYETRVKIQDLEVIKKLISEFKYLFQNDGTRYLDIGHAGRQIYAEPPN